MTHRCVIDRKELESRRFKAVCDALGWQPYQLAGLLTLFWHATRQDKVAIVDGLDDLRPYMPDTGATAFEFVANALLDARYIVWRGGQCVIEDNRDYFDANAWRVDAARKAARRRVAKGRGLTVVPSDKAAPGKDLRKEAWDAYAATYRARYGTDPLRNARANSLVKSFVGHVGCDAPRVLRFYVDHGDAFYVRKCHPLNLAVQDADALYTQYKTGNMVTAASSREAEKRTEYIKLLRQIEQDKERANDRARDT